MSLQQILLSYLTLGIQSLLTFIINQILSFAMNLLSILEKHKTKSDRMKSLTIKVIVTQTINTCLIYGFLYIMNPINPLSNYGIVKKMTGLVFISGIINIVTSILLPGRTIKKLINLCTIKEEEDSKVKMFQV